MKTIDEKLKATEIQDADIQPQALTVAEPSLMQMIDFCVRNGGASGENRNAIEMLKELRAMRDADRAYAAKRAFDEAMKAAQDEIEPVIADAINSKTEKRYATFKALNKELRPIYLEHGFTLSFGAAPSPKADELHVICDVTHDKGHTQRYMVPMSTDPSGPKGGGVMNPMQAYSASLSYGRSNLLKIIFNVVIDDVPPEPQRLEDLTERLENMRDGDRKSLDKVYADNWAAAAKINDLQSLYDFIKFRIKLCETVQELNAVGKAAFDGVAVFKNGSLTNRVTGCINARKGEFLK